MCCVWAVCTCDSRTKFNRWNCSSTTTSRRSRTPWRQCTCKHLRNYCHRQTAACHKSKEPQHNTTIGSSSLVIWSRWFVTIPKSSQRTTLWSTFTRNKRSNTQNVWRFWAKHWPKSRTGDSIANCSSDGRNCCSALWPQISGRNCDDARPIIDDSIIGIISFASSCQHSVSFSIKATRMISWRKRLDSCALCSITMYVVGILFCEKNWETYRITLVVMCNVCIVRIRWTHENGEKSRFNNQKHIYSSLAFSMHFKQIYSLFTCSSRQSGSTVVLQCAWQHKRPIERHTKFGFPLCIAAQFGQATAN